MIEGPQRGSLSARAVEPECQSDVFAGAIEELSPSLGGMTWRFNNRKNPFLFRDTMLRLIRSENLEYNELTKAA